MTRSTASRAVAVFIIGAAISSGVLAAPAPSPMTPTMTGAQTQGLISRSSDGPVGMLSEGQTQEFAARQRGGVEHATIVPQTRGRFTELLCCRNCRKRASGADTAFCLEAELGKVVSEVDLA
ncbi:hypothetical protein EV361DRAFT_952073 [Lentinula raphanica]|nr:hypothetical protein EV361DRAFT_952073 [Lentinula raphanica]